MPAVAVPRGFKLQTLDPSSPKGFKVHVPERLAKALRPEMFKGQIPQPITLSPQGQPFGGELSEEQHDKVAVLPANSQNVVVATLRRRWNLVGFSVDPGGATMAINAALQVIVRGMRAIVPASVLLIPPGAPVAHVAIFVACRCELVLFGSTGDGATAALNVKGTIWGMAQQ